MGDPIIMAYLCRRGVGVTCLGVFIHVALWSLLLTRESAALLVRSLFGLSVGVCGRDACMSLALLL
jgi:hypothetical protein